MEKLYREYRPVNGYRGRYEVTSDGLVISIQPDGSKCAMSRGRYINLCQDGIVEKVKVAYLVARAFVPNMEIRPYVIHKDGDRDNNCADNLAWSETPERNKPERAVLVFDRKGEFCKKYDSTMAAAVGFKVSIEQIRKAMKNPEMQINGFYLRRS